MLDENHVFSDLYHKRAPYKIFWGGRGAAKSWAFAEALIRIAAANPVRVLCVREFQNSIKDSSHKLLKDTITRLGLDGLFNVTADSIKSRVGAEFMFKGCHNNLDSLRSTEGIDYLWAEEGHSISEASWRVLIPTLRKETSEVWVSFNMNEENDATYMKFVEHPRTGSIIHKVNYETGHCTCGDKRNHGNPYFSGKSRKDMEDDKRLDFELYQHVWLGFPKRVSNAIILSGKYRVEDFPDDLWVARCDRPRYGADFGFSMDPSTLLRLFIIEPENSVVIDAATGLPDKKRRLYISHEAYGIRVEINNMPEFYDQVPGSKDWPIGADNARPETISYLRNQGYNIYGADKWDGSVKDGIAHLRGYDEIIIHPRCVETAKEAYLYRYKVDPKVVDSTGQPMVLPIVVDKHNHCWDGIRYGLDGEIQSSGSLGQWARLGKAAENNH